MKPPLPAVLYGTGLLLAFGAGWFFKPAASPGNAAALSPPALPAKRPGQPFSQKPVNALAASGGNWLDAASADVAAVRAAMQPGVVNQVLLDKLQASLRLQDDNIRLTHWKALVEVMRKEDTAAVKDLWWQELSQGRETAGLAKAYWQQWGKIDGLVAADMAAKGWGEDVVNDVLTGWGRVDPTAALGWLKLNAGAVERTARVKAIASGMAIDSPAAAIQFIRSHAEQADFQEALGLEMDFAVRDKGLSAAVVDFDEIAHSSLPDAYKKANLRSLAAIYRNAPFASAAGSEMWTQQIEVTRRYVDQPWFSPGVGAELGTILGATNPESGVAEIERFHDTKGRELFTYNLFDEWSRKNPFSLSQWLTTNRGHEVFDLAAFRLVLNTSQADPDAAKAWAAEIKDPAFRINLPEILIPQSPAATGQ